VVAELAERSQPLAETRTPGANHHQNVGPSGHEHVEDLGEGEQLVADVMDVLAGTQDVNPMGLHVVFSDGR
jgi:hypothetical protein